MDANDLAHVVETGKGFDEAVVSVLRSVEKKGWSLFAVHDIQERLAAKGFELGRVKIIEICSAKYASQFLGKNALVSICLPCKISVFEEKGKVKIAGMLPRMMPMLFPEIKGEETAEAEAAVKEIVDNAK